MVPRSGLERHREPLVVGEVDGQRYSRCYWINRRTGSVLGATVLDADLTMWQTVCRAGSSCGAHGAMG